MRAGLFSLVMLATSGVALAQSAPSAYTTATRYDAARRVVGTISPDPDGAGGNPHLAVRNTYDDGGRLIRVETGELADWKPEHVAPQDWGSSFTVRTTSETTYDAVNRKLKETVRSGAAGPVEKVTQYSYDAAGRLECTGVRMNPAVFASLPSSACTPSTAGSAGPDRITRNHYDAANQLVRVEQGVGTDVRIDYTRYEYTLNGQQKAVIDANGNRAEFTYDGLDRRAKWVFPSRTLVGQADSADYEEYTYDANGNRTSLRKRDGRTIVYAYDALNRVTSKTYPNGGARDVHYTYDLRGLQLTAKFDSPHGPGVATSYNGFGLPTSSESNVSGANRVLSYLHDANGNRTRVTHPDSQYFDYHRDGLDRLHFATSSSAPLFYPPYDAAGRVGTLYRLNLTAWAWSFGTSLAYDGISRLSSYGHAFTNTGASVLTSFSYNPANQITSRTRANDDYRFTGNVNVDRAYAANGLNQYASVASNSYVYDANGNLTSDGTTNYTYDIENRLVSTSTGVTLTYDPLGRLSQTYSPSTGTTQFLYDGDALVAEYDGAGNMLKRYVHGTAAGVDDPLVEYVGSSTTSPRYLFADHQGSIIAIADANGNRIAVNGYDEYGIPNGYAGSGTPNTGRFQYTGQAWIPELGMYHYKARVYSPTLGRFLQTDPIGYDDQVNLYAYVANDPVNRVDFNGKESGGVAHNSALSLSEGIKDNPPPRWALVLARWVPLSGPIIRAAEAVFTPPNAPISPRGPMPKGRCCFVAGTLVDTGSGLRPIEEIKTGDLVWSRNAATGETKLKPVIALIQRHERVIWQISLIGADGVLGRFETTDDHPWWIEGLGWRKTEELRPGMVVASREGGKLTVAAILETSMINETYNLTIADFGTYFVGKQRALVHNCDLPPLKPSTAVGERVRTPDTTPDAFVKLPRGQGYRDAETGTIMQNSRTNHSRSPGGEIKAGVGKDKPPTPGAKVTISGGREGGCVLKKDGC